MSLKFRIAVSSLTLTALVVGFDAQGAGYGSNNDAIWLDQNWDDEAKDRFYHEPQGSPIMPYSWFLSLEQPDSKALFRDDDYLQSFGMILSPVTDRNPDGLPVGLTKDFGIHGIEQKLGMNCGACHVGELSYRGKTVILDGGASRFDFWSFMEDLGKSLEKTYNDDAKFSRFADAVIGPDATKAQRTEMHHRLRGVLEERQDWSFRNASHVLPGPGRVDALNIILNQVTAKTLGRPDNARPSDAPVSFPFVWDTPYLDYAQYNAVVPNAGVGALGRNVGQVLGVFGEVSIIPSTIPPGYASSVNFDHLIELEETLQTLTSPSWKELADKGILPQLDAQKIELGESLFGENCVACHVTIDRLDRGELASIPVTKISMEQIGTDPVAAMSFAEREVATGPLQGRKTDFLQGQPLCERIHANEILAHITVGVMMHNLNTTGVPIAEMIVEAIGDSIGAALKGLWDKFSLKPHGKDKSADSDQAVIAKMSAQGASEEDIIAALKSRSDNKSALFKMLMEESLRDGGPNRKCLAVLETAQYRARPLNGIWSSAPFLHNGSVPTLRDMLLPGDQRPTTFQTGSIELDTDAVGFVATEGQNTWLFDTAIEGNDNTGHDFGTDLSAKDKDALLEYLKSL